VALPLHDGEPAGIVSRLAAGAVDAVILLALLAVAYLALVGTVFMIDPVRFRFPVPSRLVCIGCALVLLVCYLAISWTAAGRTYGDQVLGLRVVDHGGHPVRLGRSLLRAVFCALFPLGLLWVVVSRRRGSVQDLVLRTSVIYDWTPHNDVADTAGIVPARRDS
jgi:uncharacterized RDD family membrane protein YckC